MNRNVNDMIRISGHSPDAPIHGNEFKFTVGIENKLVSIGTVVVLVNKETAFSRGKFRGNFSQSSYSRNLFNNGYHFSIKRNGVFTSQNVSVTVMAETASGSISTHTYQLLADSVVQYPEIPFGENLGLVPLSSFTGEGGPSVLSNASGIGFFSPSLNKQSGDSKIDVMSFEVSSTPTEKYSPPSESNPRPWLWGPPPASPPPSPPPFPPTYSEFYEPVLNAEFCFMGTTKRSVLGVLTDTGTSQSVMILY
jgi:hypothetical protein